jgi:hypothetical protein
MALWGLDILTASGLLIFAATPPIQCVVPRAPVITVNPTTTEIQYDFSKNGEEIAALGQTDTISPYSMKVDKVSLGLRVDKPEFKYHIELGRDYYEEKDAVCLWYEQIEINIELKPYIYISHDTVEGTCREEVVAHEEKHVEVDRRVINDYSRKVGQAVAEAVNKAGAMGPVRMQRLESTQELMFDHIEAVVKSHDLELQREMRKQQALVDTLEEYERVNNICNKSFDE